MVNPLNYVVPRTIMINRLNYSDRCMYNIVYNLNPDIYTQNAFMYLICTTLTCDTVSSYDAKICSEDRLYFAL
jgi:hypothetical protein